MSLRPLLVTIAVLTAAASALADVGPVAPCGAGEHHEYYQGHKCVPNGYHLNHQGRELKNGAPDPDAPRPPDTSERSTSASSDLASLLASIPSASAAPATMGNAPPPAEPQARKTCTATSPGDASSGASGLVLAACLALAFVTRSGRAVPRR